MMIDKKHRYRKRRKGENKKYKTCHHQGAPVDGVMAFVVAGATGIGGAAAVVGAPDPWTVGREGCCWAKAGIWRAPAN